MKMKMYYEIVEGRWNAAQVVHSLIKHSLCFTFELLPNEEFSIGVKEEQRPCGKLLTALNVSRTTQGK